MHGWWDRLRLEQVVTNLVSNAIRYGAGRPIHARVEVVGENARLVVRDEGIGIPPEALERIFGKFERAVSERHSGGLGLGLYITHSIVEAMGGTIRVESRPGQGSTFTVELPRSPPPETRR
ncbi:sensor histidine kinase [Archangium gephyra]|uniref:sensor histidine kinase n=1 Tax=Archangium gephyra TaxID=48 RepID=UPI003B808C49